MCPGVGGEPSPQDINASIWSILNIAVLVEQFAREDMFKLSFISLWLIVGCMHQAYIYVHKSLEWIGYTT